MKTIVFVDYWNLQLSLQREDAISKQVNIQNHRFYIDWYKFGQNITSAAQTTIKTVLPPGESLYFQEARFYTSANPNDGGKYKRWVTGSLNRQPGVQVFCLDRKPRRHATCPNCHEDISHCNHCQKEIKATQEKGVDTLLVTDLLRLGLDGTYDAAIVVSQDSDMKPAVDHLSSKGIKVVHAGIKHFGADLSSSCWATFDLFPIRHILERSN